MNAMYKLLTKLTHSDNVEFGQGISLDVDLALAHDGSMPKIIKEASKLDSFEKLLYSNKLNVTVDHFLPSPSSNARETFVKIKEFCESNEINLYSHGEGVLHQVVAEKFGSEMREKVVVGVDGHICTSAALGALPFSITPEEMLEVLKTGRYSFVVPKVVNVDFTGDFRYDENGNIAATGKDVALYIIGRLGSKELKDNGVVFTGKALENLTQSQRMTISNMMGEVGVKTVYFDDTKDKDGDGYHKKFELSAEDIQSLISLPGSPENVKPIEEVSEVLISQVFIGGCTNGRLDDMKDVAEILSGKKVHKNVTLIVCPASRKVANDMDRLGYSEIIRESGGIIINPSCGACSGAHQGVLGKDDIVLTTTARNSVGRMGSEEAKIYLASPRIAAKSAIEGRICK